MNKFIEFFEENTSLSMTRLLAFICGISALIMSIGAIWLGFHSALTYDYILLNLGLWAATFGGKNWSKSIEINKNKEE